MSENKVVTTDARGNIKIMTFDKYSLYTASTAAGQRARMVFGIRDGNPRITVFTNDPADTTEKTRGMISAPMDGVTFMGFLNLIKKVAATQGESSFSVDCLTSVRDDSGKITDKILLCKAYVGKDSEGNVFLSLIADGRPRIKFPLAISSYHSFNKADGTQLTAAEASTIAATALSEILTTLYKAFIIDAVKEQIATPRQPAGNRTAQRSGPGPDTLFEDIPV